MSLISKIQSLISSANAVTGESRTDLTSAVQDLKDGYGGGGQMVSDYCEGYYTEITVGENTISDSLAMMDYLRAAVPSGEGDMLIFGTDGTPAYSQYVTNATFNNGQYQTDYGYRYKNGSFPKTVLNNSKYGAALPAGTVVKIWSFKAVNVE